MIVYRSISNSLKILEVSLKQLLRVFLFSFFSEFSSKNSRERREKKTKREERLEKGLSKVVNNSFQYFHGDFAVTRPVTTIAQEINESSHSFPFRLNSIVLAEIQVSSGFGNDGSKKFLKSPRLTRVEVSRRSSPVLLFNRTRVPSKLKYGQNVRG